jgi:hypothetical protein
MDPSGVEPEKMWDLFEWARKVAQNLPGMKPEPRRYRRRKMKVNHHEADKHTHPYKEGWKWTEVAYRHRAPEVRWGGMNWSKEERRQYFAGVKAFCREYSIKPKEHENYITLEYK